MKKITITIQDETKEIYLAEELDPILEETRGFLKELIGENHRHYTAGSLYNKLLEK